MEALPLASSQVLVKEIEVWQKQYDFLCCEDRFKGFIGGIGSGKTFAGVLESLKHAEPGSLGLVVAPTYPMLRDATVRTFLGLLEGMPYQFNKSQMILALPNGAEILFRSADEPDRLRGPNLHWAYLDEAALCLPETWLLIIGRLRAKGKARPCWVTTTPRGKKNWLYERLDRITMFQAMTRENPYLDPVFIKDLEANYAGQFYKQELEGAFVSYEGLVYEEFDRPTHVQSEIDREFKKVVFGLDEGYTNPSAMVVIGLDSDDRIHIVDEFYQRRILQGDLVDYVYHMKKQYRASCVFVDPSAAGLIAALRARGLPAMEGDNRVFDGIQRVKARLAVQGDGKPRMFVHRRCVNTIAEMEGYIWNDRKLKEEPVKQNDHLMDALRYSIMGARQGSGIYL